MKTAADHFPHNQISVPPSCIPMVAPCVRESSVKKKQSTNRILYSHTKSKSNDRNLTLILYYHIKNTAVQTNKNVIIDKHVTLMPPYSLMSLL